MPWADRNETMFAQKKVAKGNKGTSVGGKG